MATKKKVYTDAMDDRMDKKAGIKENSAADRALDSKRGVPEDDSKKTSKGTAGTKTAKTPGRQRRQP